MLVEGEMQLTGFRRMIYRLPLTFQVLASPRGISHNLDCFDLSHELESTQTIFRQIREHILDFWALDSKNSFMFLLDSGDICFLTKTQVLFLVIEDQDKTKVETRFRVSDKRVFSLSQLFGSEVQRYSPRAERTPNVDAKAKRTRSMTEPLKDAGSVWASAFSDLSSKPRILEVIENSFEKTVLRFNLPTVLSLIVQCLDSTLILSAFPAGDAFSRVDLTKQRVVLENVHPLECSTFGNPNFYQLVPGFAFFCQLQVGKGDIDEQHRLPVPLLTAGKGGGYRECSFEYLREINRGSESNRVTSVNCVERVQKIIERDFQVMNKFGGALFGDSFLFSAMQRLFLMFTYSTKEVGKLY